MFSAKDAVAGLEDEILLLKWYNSNGEFNLAKYPRFSLNSSIIENCIASIVKKAIDRKFELKMPTAVQKYFLEYFNKMYQMKTKKSNF